MSLLRSLVSRIRSLYGRCCLRSVQTHIRSSLLFPVVWYDFFQLRAFLRRQTRLQGRRQPSVPSSPDQRFRIAFVIPWFGKDVSGGAEAETYGLIQALRTHVPDVDVEVLSSTLPEFAQDWNRPVHPEGCRVEDGITVHRFNPRGYDRTLFHWLNGTHLMVGGTRPLWDAQGRARSPLPRWLEPYFVQRMVAIPGLIAYMEAHWHAYDAFVMIPYMFSSTVRGCAVAGSKGMLIPCLHDERYAHLQVCHQAFAAVGAVLCHVRSEAQLFAKLYPHAPSPLLLGEQVDTQVSVGDAARFRQKYGIQGPFLLYAGRQIEGKNLPLLIDYFRCFRQTHPEWASLELVLIGKGDLDYSREPGVRALGFIPSEDKKDAYRAATALAMLSVNESFSIVLMEAWLQETPVIVSAECAVTCDHVQDSSGGAAVADAEEFAEAVMNLLSHPEQREEQGRRGRTYVLKNYTAEQVAMRFREALGALSGPSL